MPRATLIRHGWFVKTEPRRATEPMAPGWLSPVAPSADRGKPWQAKLCLLARRPKSEIPCRACYVLAMCLLGQLQEWAWFGSFALTF